MKSLRYLLRLLMGKFREMQNRNRPVGAIFADIYRKKLWGDRESVSGTGSKQLQTEKVVAFIPEVIRQYNIQSMLDIPCGDFNWMKNVNLGNVKYIGADIIEEMILDNRRSYETPTRTFIRADVIVDVLPKTDLILCRDCLVHFSNEHLIQAIKNLKRSGATYLLTTTFPEHVNKDIVTGNWRGVNLQKPPFSFPEPLILFNEGYHQVSSGNADKSLALWRISDLP